MSHIRFKAPDLAIDLGTANTIVARPDGKILINEPTVLALDYKKMEILAIGKEAKDLIGKSPKEISPVCPMENGVISDFDLAQAMLESSIHKAIPGVSLIAPRVAITIPSGASDVENRAIQDAVLQSGARNVYLIEEPLASAYGAGLIQEDTRGAMVLNIGAGSSEVAVVSRYGVITSETLHSGGDLLDGEIEDYIRDRYELIIGKNTAERLKIAIGTLHEDQQMNAMEISGRDASSGLPKSIDVYASDITAAMTAFINELVEAVLFTLEKTPPELASDILNKGLMITGGASQIDGLDEYISSSLHIKVNLSKDPLYDTIHGCMLILKDIDKINQQGDKDDPTQEEKK